METLFPIQYSYLIPLLPLLGAIIAGCFGAKVLRGKSHWPIWIGVGLSAILSISLMTKMLGLWHEEAHTEVVGVEVTPHEDRGPTETTDYQHVKPVLNYNQDFFDWISAGDFNVKAGFYFDALTATMLCVVTGIGFFITVFAAGYMKGEEGYFRFFAYLGLFIFMMTMLVMGNNLVMLYLGWEGVGLCSYLLIGYYYDKPSAREAAKKAFLVNRVGDFGFGLGIMLCFLAFGTVTYFGGQDNPGQGLLELAMNPNHPGAWSLKYIPFLLMMGAFGKSAQFPLHVWLPDAMEGPTPVSALIHAATMVTAGVYMIVRCGTLFFGNHAAMMTIAGIGLFTALFAATIALRQFDLKKIFAYSTVSQLGFMFVAVGCLAPVAGVFHLVTHAFFKALLFLSSGVVMHAMAGELDLRKMSGLKRVLPITRWMMLIGCAALAGFPFLSGFFSKDEILAAAWIQNRFLGLMLLLVAFLTAYYSFRLYFRVFTGPEIIPPPPADAHGGHGHDAHSHDAHGHGDHHHNHEPATMMLPLIVLAIGAIAAGYLNFPERQRSLAGFLGTSLSLQRSYQIVTREVDPEHIVAPLPFGQFEDHHEIEKAAPDFVRHEESLHRSLMFVSGMVSVLGIYLAYVMHRKRRTYADELAAQMRPITRVLEAKYWLDEIYQAAIIEPLRDLGRLLYAFDRFIVDGLVGIIGLVPQLSGFALKLSTQRGYLQGYAVSMLFGIVVILLIVFI